MQAIFTEFWPFVASVIILGVVFDGLEKCIYAWRSKNEEEDDA